MKMCAFCKINIFRECHEKDLFNCAKQKVTKLRTLNGDVGFFTLPPVSLEGLTSNDIKLQLLCLSKQAPC